MNIIRFPDRKTWESLTARPELRHEQLYATVEEIMNEVRSNGDMAVRACGEKFDRVRIEQLQVSGKEMEEAAAAVPIELQAAIRRAKKNIETFHRAQIPVSRKIETEPGVVCWQKSVAIEKVGLYIPGGTAPLFSTVLMLAIPAVIAGCREIVLCTPPDSTGNIHPAILFAAKEAGVEKIFKTGGIQAIAAMAYGTASIPQTHKIFGPGNRYVTAAKKWASMYAHVAIDMPAGPSEVEIIADASAHPAFIAADMLSQAEHGIDSQSILMTSCEKLVEQVAAEIDRQLSILPRREITARSLENSRIILLEGDDEIVELTNLYAPEHLIIETGNHAALSERIIHAGSVFLGHYTPESAGDYASGTNHTLPTGGYAKMYGGVNLDSFVRKITFQEITHEGIRRLGPVIEAMAQAESMDAHKNAVTLRMK
ncbi:MAG: histidinol dehydrogenase [Bacteroidales bacterium]|jgi:histidinol dehydrogenase|nr:histidinol dehydrogenase [Bacteroidales bacterium]